MCPSITRNGTGASAPGERLLSPLWDEADRSDAADEGRVLAQFDPASVPACQTLLAAATLAMFLAEYRTRGRDG